MCVCVCVCVCGMMMGGWMEYSNEVCGCGHHT